MKLQKIRNAILTSLKELTIEDFYVINIEEFLNKKIGPELEPDAVGFSIWNYTYELLNAILKESDSDVQERDLNIIISEYTVKIIELQTQNKQLENTVYNYKSQIVDIEKRIESLNFYHSENLNSLNNFEEEAEKIKDLIHTDFYKNRNEEIIRQTTQLLAEINSFAQNKLELNTDITNLNLAVVENKTKIDVILKDISNYEIKIESLRVDIKNIDRKKHQKEREAFRFLNELMWEKQYKEQRVEKKNYGNNNQNSGRDRNFYGNYHNHNEPQFDTINIEYYIKKDLKILLVKHIEDLFLIPDGWRSKIYNLFINPLPEIKGTYENGVFNLKYASGKDIKFNYDNYSLIVPEVDSSYDSEDSDEDYHYNERYQNYLYELSFEPVDYSIFLSIKTALKTGSTCIRTEKESIMMTLSGGMMAEFRFKRTGKFIGQLKKSHFGLFFPLKLEETRLYGQIGYANSSLCIAIRPSYHLISDEYIMIVKLFPAPILFESKTIALSTSNISGKSKIDDELEKEKEEERKKKEFEKMMDYYDDWDDF